MGKRSWMRNEAQGTVAQCLPREPQYVHLGLLVQAPFCSRVATPRVALSLSCYIKTTTPRGAQHGQGTTGCPTQSKKWLKGRQGGNRARNVGLGKQHSRTGNGKKAGRTGPRAERQKLGSAARYGSELELVAAPHRQGRGHRCTYHVPNAGAVQELSSLVSLLASQGTEGCRVQLLAPGGLAEANRASCAVLCLGGAWRTDRWKH